MCSLLTRQTERDLVLTRLTASSNSSYRASWDTSLLAWNRASASVLSLLTFLFLLTDSASKTIIVSKTQHALSENRWEFCRSSHLIVISIQVDQRELTHGSVHAWRTASWIALSLGENQGRKKMHSPATNSHADWCCWLLIGTNWMFIKK